MSIAEYTRKRDFAKTKEPKGAAAKRAIEGKSRARFVIQKHDARRLHYDLRLESEGVLLSWAVPKGPSLDPNDKRLAVHVEDHPLEYASFEGSIPKGEYGAGTVMVWDTGYWLPKSDVNEGMKKGRLSFTLHGEKLNGDWRLARMRGKSDDDQDNWLLIKSDDEFAAPGDNDALLREKDESALTGRDLDAIAAAQDTDPKIDASALPDAKPVSDLPKSLGPQLATLADAPPDGEDWIHEIKYDGYRLIAICKGKSVTLKTRNDKDWTSKFPNIQRALQDLAFDDCVVDGELIAPAENGVSDFQSLQNALKQKKGANNLQFMAFDLPYALGTDLRNTPLLERKRLLKALLSQAGFSDTVRYSDHVRGSGEDVFQHACELGLEGIICKRASSGYSSRRSRDWLKVKCDRRQEFIVCGFTEPSGSRIGFGALHLAYYEGKTLRYAGKVGTGFNDKLLKRLRKEFEALAVEQCPLPNTPSDSAGTTWMEPEPVAEIKYTEQTKEGLLRHPVFLGLREDKPAQSVGWESPASTEKIEKAAKKASSKKQPKSRREKTANSAKADKASKSSNKGNTRLTNPDRILYPNIGATKERVASYYEAVSEWMLPYVSHRPLALLRHPKGWTEKGFFHKHIDESFPDAVKRVDIGESGDSAVYGYVTDSAGLVGLLQMGTLEIHAWGSRVDDVEKPDQIVMDLDPDEGLPSEAVVGAALLLRDLLEEETDLKSFLKTTGGKGLHVVIPLRRGPSWDEVKAFSKAVAEALRDRNPQAFVTTASKQKRKGKIYVDYLRNGRGATAIAPFSTRAREGAPVSVPLAWDEADASLKSSAYTIENVTRRLAQLKRDPWEDYSKTRQGLNKSIKASFGLG